MNSSAFDIMAKSYDNDFTDTAAGRIQRETVWKHLTELVEHSSPKSILEVGCGTGEDAIFLSGLGAEIWASDPSAGMLEVAKKKTKESGYENRIHFSQNGFEDCLKDKQDIEFRILLGNFGCINCLPPEKLESAFRNIHSHMERGSRAVLVVLPPFSLFETLGFGSRLRFKKAIRRWGSQPKKFQMDGKTQDVWYYSPETIRAIAGSGWKVKKIVPLGFFLPPGGMNSILFKTRFTAWCLKALERMAARMEFLSGISDHFLIDLEKTG